jgi:hypothetical protein
LPVDRGWVAVANRSEDGKVLTYAEELDAVKSANPALKLETCKNQSHLQYPPLEKNAEDYFHIVIEQKSGTPLEAMPENICASAGLVESYGRFVSIFYPRAVAVQLPGLEGTALEDPMKRDEFLLKLLDQIKNEMGRVTIVISEQDGLSATHQGEIREPTYYTTSTKSIHWHSPEMRAGIGMMMQQRRPVNLLKHELTHLLLHHLLQDRYPKKTIWHFGSKNDWGEKARESAFQNELTSPDAAYVEGLANAFETDGRPMVHPTLFDPGDLGGLNTLQPGRDDYLLKVQATHERVCYLRPQFYFDRAQSVLNHSSSEAFVGTSIAALMRRSSSTQVLKALTESKPSSLIELAHAVDRLQSEPIGSQWLREFYLVDSTTGENQSKLFEKVGNTYCLREEKSDRSLFSTQLK